VDDARQLQTQTAEWIEGSHKEDRTGDGQRKEAGCVEWRCV